MNKVDYKKICEFLGRRKGKFTSASNIAHFVGAERIHGATMSKLVREGYLEKSEMKGFYKVL